MSLKLNVYKNKKVEKTYEVDEYEVMFGTVEDILKIIDIDKIGDNVELVKMVIKSLNKIKPFLKEIFQDISDEELRRTKTKEIISLFVQIISSSISDLGSINGNKAKN